MYILQLRQGNFPDVRLSYTTYKYTGMGHTNFRDVPYGIIRYQYEKSVLYVNVFMLFWGVLGLAQTTLQPPRIVPPASITL
jgi:hypothetical protein